VSGTNNDPRAARFCVGVREHKLDSRLVYQVWHHSWCRDRLNNRAVDCGMVSFPLIAISAILWNSRSRCQIGRFATHLICCTTKRPNIRTESQSKGLTFIYYELGCHPPNSSLNRACGVTCWANQVFDDLRQPEISQHCTTAVGNENIILQNDTQKNQCALAEKVLTPFRSPCTMGGFKVWCR
jgi:hypothetical protein